MRYRLAGATTNQLPLDWGGNRRRITKLIGQARQSGCHLVAFPELCLSGYGCDDTFFSPTTARDAEASLAELIPATSGIAVVVGLPYRGPSHPESGSQNPNRNPLYNTAAVIQDGRLLGVCAKRVLARDGVHYEPRWFDPWPFGHVEMARLAGFQVPIGDLRFHFGQLGVAMEICEEAWGAVPAATPHAPFVDVVINPSASPFALGKYPLREELVAQTSAALKVCYLYTNHVGLEAGRLIYDGGVLVAEQGQVVARGPRFGFEDGILTIHDLVVDEPKTKLQRPAEPSPSASSPSPVVIGRAPHEIAPSVDRPHQELSAPTRDQKQTHRLSAEEEFLHAEMLGLFDYLRKAQARGYVVSLSGGCDSATTALLVAHTIHQGCRELGTQNFAKRLGIAVQSDPTSYTHALLSCVYQASDHSSETTRSAAQQLAQALNARFHQSEIGPIVATYTKQAEDILGRPLSWQEDDLALQNIQARARSPLPWMIANLYDAILLTTSNRSEAAVGYATMDGDMAGGLAPIAGIDKAFLRQWLRWAETDCQLGMGPVAALAAVNALEPTAELRPGVSQRDESDLMPYPLLNEIERLYVRERLGWEEIQRIVTASHPDISPDAIQLHVKTFARLFGRSQWKRERLAPSFHIEEQSLDPKTWCRYPILSQPPF